MAQGEGLAWQTEAKSAMTMAVREKGGVEGRSDWLRDSKDGIFDICSQ